MAMYKNELVPFIDSPSILPENSFTNWLKDMTKERDFNSIKTKNIDIKVHYRDIKKFKYVEHAIRGNNNKYDNASLKQEIDNWNPQTPVIISAPTGSGKNTFIMKNLVKRLFKKYGFNKKILLLSNRVALNRQSKLNYLDELQYLTRNEYFKTEKDNRTPQGLDTLTDFKIIWILSYQQLYERNIKGKGQYIDLNQFDYVVFDEAHFFTSDATFNVNTDELLKYAVMEAKNAVRIYMTATIETVFGVILKAEYNDTERIISQAEYCRNMQRPGSIEIFNIENEYNSMPLSLNKVGSKIDDIDSNIDEANEQFRANPKHTMVVHFYYMSCNYEYIDAYTYKDEDELIPKIEKSKDKWLIFVSKLSDEDEKVPFNNIQGKTIAKLSRRRIDNKEKSKSVYNNIIETEKFEEDVVIVTSLMDNGINIKEDKVKNIVIDGIFDRVEFKQMIGRIRVKEGERINLYIRDYTTEDLKKMLKRIVSRLIRILYIDLLNPEQQQEYYESIADLPERYGKVMNQFRIVKRIDRFCEYNENAIPNLIEQASCILRLIKIEEPDYVVELNIDDMDILYRLNEYYKNGKGSDKIWSRSLIDIIETMEGLEERQEAIFDEKRHTTIDMGKQIKEKYNFKFDDYFVTYLYSELIPQYFNKKIEERINSINKNLNGMFEKIIYGIDNPIEKLRILKEHLKKMDSIDISKEEEFYKKIKYYQNLADTRNITNAVQEQLRWLEKDSFDKATDDINEECSEVNNSLNNNKEEFKIKITTVKEFTDATEYIDGKYKCRNENFWEQYGYARNSVEAKFIADKYFKGELLSRKPEGIINGNRCKIESIYRMRDRTVFYVILKVEEASEEKISDDEETLESEGNIIDKSD